MTWPTFSLVTTMSIVLLSLSLSSCNNMQPTGPTIIAGQLSDLASAEIKTTIGTREFLVKTDEEGNFRMELEINRDHFLWFNGIGRDLYLVPGDSMYISREEKESQAFVFKGGESALINTWYLEKDNKLGSLLDTVDIKKYYGQGAESYKKLNTWLISEFHDLLDQYSHENPGISEAFIALEKNNISHYWYYELNVYHREYPAYTGNMADLPDDFYDYLESVLLNDTVLFQYSGYRYFLYSWLDLQVHMHDRGLSGKQKTHQIFDIAAETFTIPAILADVVWENLRLQNSRMNVDEELIIRAASLGVPEKRCEIAREYMHKLQPLSAGNPAPDFKIIDVSGNTASLEDFSSKYLLIDIWSTTCSPCIREIPRLEDLKQELEGQNIEIIAVCLSNEGPWKEKLKEMGLPDHGQYRVEKGWSSTFCDNYVRGSGVPVYILIDPNGNIVNARAPYPSQGLKDVLQGLVSGAS